MYSSHLIALTFLVGLVVGWYGNTWFQSQQLTTNALVSLPSGGTEHSANPGTASSIVSDHTTPSGLTHSGLQKTENDVAQGDLINPDSRVAVAESADLSIVDTFNELLEDRRYLSAIALLQEQSQTNEPNALRLRLRLLKELSYLIEARNNNDFSDLIESYLSAYYDDIDALLLLAEFNQVNGSYHEVVNVFLLAKTYAYTQGDQERVDGKFIQFVSEIDGVYTRQTNWQSLIHFYTHISTSGLMTSTLLFKQAMAYLRSGDEAFAIQQFNQLLTDSLVGDSAAKALNNLEDDSEPATLVYDTSWDDAESIALQKLGNQYAVNLNNAQRDSVKLLIDTGASMTAVSTESFNILNANGDAVEQGNRVFRTANGLVQAAVFSVPELSLGSHRLENTLIAVIDFGNDRSIDGLLGMNILGQFRFQIDQESSKLRLGKK